MAALLFAGCSSSVDNAASTDSEASPLGGWKIEGVSQKGPFVTGSTVNVMELDGESMLQTGRIFKSTIKSDKGDFALEGNALISQYTMIEVNGYYRNEITGQKSSAPLTLKAITDISHRENVNVNLLTHLEFDRIMKLVSNGKSVMDAKTQAEKEILFTMAMNESSDAFEDLNIFETGEGNAKLLAISILMQNNVNVADFTERTGKLAMELAEKGSWEDMDTRASIADGACEMAQRNMYSIIRENILKWGLSDSLPNFEKFIDMFWADNFGLGKCSNSNKGDTAVNTNILSKRAGEKFVCDGSSWIATDKTLYKGVFGTLTDERDGHTYKTVQIGDQVWMAENLNYNYQTEITHSMCAKEDRGVIIVNSSDQYGQEIFETKDTPPMYRENRQDNCDEYGRIYSFAAAIDSAGLFGDGGLGCGYIQDSCDVKESSRGVCPEGWHLPSKSEWEQLFLTVGGKIVAELVLRTADNVGTDDYGFNIKQNDGFWTSTKTVWSSTIPPRIYGIRPYCLYILDGIMFQQECADHTVRCVMD